MKTKQFMKKILLALFTIISLQSFSQSYEIVKRFEQNTITLKFKEKKISGEFIITDTLLTIKNDIDNLHLKVKLYSISKNDITGIAGNIICKDDKNNQYVFTISNHMFSCIAELWDTERNDINYKTIIYTIK